MIVIVNIAPFYHRERKVWTSWKSNRV